MEELALPAGKPIEPAIDGRRPSALAEQRLRQVAGRRPGQRQQFAAGERHAVEFGLPLRLQVDRDPFRAANLATEAAGAAKQC